MFRILDHDGARNHRRFGLDLIRWSSCRLVSWPFFSVIAVCFSSILVFCGKKSLLYTVNLLFFSTNLIFGLVAIKLFGVSAYGVFVASLVSGALCFVLAYRTSGDFVFVVFVKENDDLYIAAEVTLGAFAASRPIRLRKVLAATRPGKARSPTVGPKGSVSCNHQQHDLPQVR